MKNPLKLLFCQKSGYFHENPPIGTQNLTHKIQIRINFFQKILKFGRASRAQEWFSLFSGRRALSGISTFIVWHIKSFETYLLCYSEFGQNIFLPRFYSGNLSYRCFQGSGKVCCMPSVRACFMCLPSVCCICVGRACMFCVCLMSISVFCAFRPCFAYVPPCVRVFCRGNTSGSPVNKWLTGKALWYLTN